MDRPVRSSLVSAAACALVGSTFAFAPAKSPSFVDGGPPTDFIAQADALSQPIYPDMIHEVLQMPAHDGELLYVEVTRPNPDTYPDETFPVILEASPYHGTLHGRDGTRIFPDPTDEEGNMIGLTGYFGPRGYAVAMMSLRGTGRSGGCLDHLGPNDAEDLRTVIEHLADAEWSAGRVGMTGHSYPGSTPITALELEPSGLATIVPSAGLASMYDHQFQTGVPYDDQYIGPMVSYEALALDRHLWPGTPSAFGGATGDDFGNNVEDTGCGMQTSSLTAGSGQLTGQYELWHAQRDHRDAAINTDIPVFIVHGVNDNAVRIPGAEWFFGERFGRSHDKVWIGQWDHGSTNGRCGGIDHQRVVHPTCRFDQYKYALHAWFDKHLQLRDVDTGPAVEAFLNPPDQNLDVASVHAPETIAGPVLTAASWTRTTDTVIFYPDATDGTLRPSRPAADGSASYTVAAQAWVESAAGSVTFTSEPLEEDLIVLGLPHLGLSVSQTSASTDIVVTLHNEDADGAHTPINTCAIDPILRNGINTVTPVVPGELMRLEPGCFTAAHIVPAGNRLVLEVGGSGPHHLEAGVAGQVTVHTGPLSGGYTLPIVPDATLYADAPLREDSTAVGFDVGGRARSAEPPSPSDRAAPTAPLPETGGGSAAISLAALGAAALASRRPVPRGGFQQKRSPGPANA